MKREIERVMQRLMRAVRRVVMMHPYKIKEGIAQSREERKGRLKLSALFSWRQRYKFIFEPLFPCARTSFVFGLGLILVLLSACASTGRRSTATVTRLNDGRQGFVIHETPVMDSGSRADFDRAVGMMNEGKNDAAIDLLTRVIYRSPGVTAPHIDIAMAYMRTGKTELAEQHFKAALALVPSHPVASNEYGLLLRRSGRFKEARDVYENAIDVFPEYLPARKNLGILCDLYLNDSACALRQFETYSKAMPADEQVKTWIAELRMRQGKK